MPIIFDLDDTLVDELLRPCEGAVEVLERAKALDDLYMLSYNPFARHIVEANGWTRYFERVTSCIGLKSNAAERILNLNLSECVLFDDAPFNVHDFEKTGGKAYLVENRDVALAFQKFVDDKKKD